jgi:uncharacterized protein
MRRLLEILALVIPGIILALLLSAWAHFADERPPLAILLYVVFGFAALLFLGLGGLMVVLSDELASELGDGVFNVRSGLFMILIGAAIGISLLPPFRALLSRVMPINAKSMPDMVGLALMLAISVTTIWTIELTFANGNGEDEIASVGEASVILQAVLLVGIAYFGIGGAINRGFSDVIDRLGLHRPTAQQVVISVALIIPIFIVSAIGGVLTDIFQPGLTDDIQEIMGEVTADLITIQGALLIGLTAGIGEEILFRGAIQPRYGLIFTSIVFTLIHVQYGFSFVLLGLFLTSIILGIQRQKMNTTCCIITHSVYNFSVVMISVVAGSQM